MWCFGGREEDTSDGRDDISHEKRHEIERKKHEKRKKNHPIKRLPTFLVRNKAPCGNPAFERLINVALLGIHRHDSAESAYLEKLSDRLVQAFYDAGGREDRKLSRAAFAFFLTRVQGDRVVGNPPAREEYTYKEFLEEWTVKYGLGALGALRPEQKDLSKPISNYFISSSHNTYLEGHQLYSQSSSQIYQKVLDRHCRCIEIDVWDGDSTIYAPSRSKSPDLAHRRPHSSSSLPTFEGMKKRFIRPNLPNVHRRQVSATEPMLPQSVSAEDSSSVSSNTLDPEAFGDRLRPRQPTPKHNIDESEPVVMHAWQDPASRRILSLTNPVGFREVCKAVRDSAFSSGNHLPIIVSLEVHARFEQQEVMVKIMKDEWAGCLLDKPVDGCDPLERQPRLEELLDKILVKVKRPASKSAVSTPKLPSTPKVQSTPKVPTLAVPGAYDEELSHSDDERCERTGTKRTPICESLAALAIYTHSEHFKAFDTPSARTPGHIFSIVEGKIRELHEKMPDELFEHNRRFMMRAYPHPITRISSHNPDPSLFWRAGVQMVALNWQDGKYEKMSLHDAMFTEDTQGWVLKPRGYRSTDGENDKPERRTLTLTITIYAGLYIPLPNEQMEEDVANGAVTGDGAANKHFKPSVQVDLVVPHEKGAGKLERKTGAGATVHPDWGPRGCRLEFVGVQNVVEELSFVRFKIRDESPYIVADPVAAWACIRLDRLRRGYRLVDLMDCKGNASKGKLFVRIDKRLQRAGTMSIWNRMSIRRSGR